jgi:GTP diphosphokinase / guanosine-3',5'-bis(diphosphate) 3'-diphosphatase
MSTALTRAITLAAQVHDGQLDKAGEPYILHILRVVTTLDPGLLGPELSTVGVERARIVAVLHDTREDGNLAYHDIHAKFGYDIADCVDALTRREGERYTDYISRIIAHSPIARIVKAADLMDNLQSWRQPVGETTAQRESRQAKYRKALKRVLGENDQSQEQQP